MPLRNRFTPKAPLPLLKSGQNSLAAYIGGNSEEKLAKVSDSNTSDRPRLVRLLLTTVKSALEIDHFKI